MNRIFPARDLCVFLVVFFLPVVFTLQAATPGESSPAPGSAEAQSPPPPQPLPPASAPIAAQGPSLKLHEKFVARARRGGLEIVFFGDSSTTCWQTTGKDTWDREIAPLEAADFGIYGDNAQQLLWRLQNGELDGYHAKAIVMMIGAANLLHGDPPPAVAAAIAACATEIKERQPARNFSFSSRPTSTSRRSRRNPTPKTL